MEALGFIETLGLVCAIEAADSALKAANVTLVGRQNIKGGIIAVIVKGDVGAVKAAVEAETAAASNVGKVLASHVIPRMDKDTSTMLFNEHSKKAPNIKQEVVSTPKEVVESKVESEVVESEVKSEIAEETPKTVENKKSTHSKNNGKSSK